MTSDQSAFVWVCNTVNISLYRIKRISDVPMSSSVSSNRSARVGVRAWVLGLQLREVHTLALKAPPHGRDFVFVKPHMLNTVHYILLYNTLSICLLCRFKINDTC
jgi:hypothetical protein